MKLIVVGNGHARDYQRTTRPVDRIIGAARHGGDHGCVAARGGGINLVKLLLDGGEEDSADTLPHLMQLVFSEPGALKLAVSTWRRHSPEVIVFRCFTVWGLADGKVNGA